MPKPIHAPSQLYSSNFSRSLSITATLFSLLLVGLLGLRLVSLVPTPGHHLNYIYNSSKNDKLEQPFQVQVGLRPYYLVDNMDEGALKQKLQSCSEETSKVSKFVVGHRGAPLQFPEHTRESYMAAAREGAGAIECDVTFTSDKKLVCRHDQLMRPTHHNQHPRHLPRIQMHPALHALQPRNRRPRNSQLLHQRHHARRIQNPLRQDGRLQPQRQHGHGIHGRHGRFRTDLYSTCGTLLTHVESIALIDSYGRDFTPEAKGPVVHVRGYTRARFLQDIIDDYKALGIDPARVWPQSFVPEDVFWWIAHEPEFGAQAVYLDERMETQEGYRAATASLAGLARQGVRIVGPALFALTKLDGEGRIVPSEYAVEARKAGLEMLPWSFERSGWLNEGGEYFYQYIAPVIRKDGDMYTVLDVLVNDVGIFKMYSDSPATVVYYANCMGLP
ncbi:Extracellular protein [Lachnellula willkommii]|uniref:glycerophosphodiester phosphodiesterase n=1 Tax=Lachnellula willkommii TaxID=215461 RepID=A0A559MAD5_9HELO|nr:Extracellular protein [Lachnellula willkommii]